MTAHTLPDDPQYLKLAFSKLGLSEIEGARHEKQILAMFAASGHPEIHDDETPWCAAFVGWCLEESNLPTTHSLLAKSYAKYGRSLDIHKRIPRGAICVWTRTGGNHVNFCLEDNGQTLTCIGGNQSNGKGGGVTISTRSKGDLIAATVPSQLPLLIPTPPPRPKTTEEPDDETPDAPAEDQKLPWYRRWAKHIFGGLVGAGGLTVGGVTLDASTIYAFCALVGVVFVVFIGYVYLIPPRGKIKKW